MSTCSMMLATHMKLFQERGSSTIQRSERETDRLRRERDEIGRELDETRQLVARYKSERNAGRAELEVLHKEVSLALPLNVPGAYIL